MGRTSVISCVGRYQRQAAQRLQLARTTQPSHQVVRERLPQRQRMAHSRQLYHKLGHKTTRIFDNATAYQDAVNGLNEWTLLRLSTRLHRRRLVSHAATLILDRKYRQPPALTVPALHAYSMSIDGTIRPILGSYLSDTTMYRSIAVISEEDRTAYIQRGMIEEQDLVWSPRASEQADMGDR